jgi:type I restriction enzyme S subunit
VSLAVDPTEIVDASDSPLLAAADHWQRRPLGEVASILNGCAFASKRFSKDKGMPLIRIRDISTGRTTERFNGEFDERYVITDGELLVGMDGDFNVSRWAGPPALLNQRVMKIVPKEGLLDLAFLAYLLPGYLQAIHDLTSSTTVKHLSSRDVEKLPIPVPLLDEQRQIVEKIELLFEQVKSAQYRLSQIPILFKRFRQSVLAAACSGQLTADWREVNDAIDSVSWNETSLGEVCPTITSGSRDWKQYYGRGTGVFVMAQNVRPGFFDRSYRLPVDPPTDSKDRTRSQVRKGDLLITIVGANTGDVCPVVEEVVEHYVCQSVALVRPNNPGYTAFLSLWLNSPAHGQAYFESCYYGAGRPHLSFDQLRATPLELPPIDEQHEIVRRVEALFALADSIEARLNEATRQVERTTQAILAKAFRGELVGGS